MENKKILTDAEKLKIIVDASMNENNERENSKKKLDLLAHIMETYNDEEFISSIIDNLFKKFKSNKLVGEIFSDFLIDRNGIRTELSELSFKLYMGMKK